jgi:glycosyltransferase involved in cell wall biosynthesis
MTDSPERVPEPGAISVVVPTYNDVGRLGDALGAIVSQTCRPGEIVVCDDGSDDGTDQFVAEFASRHEQELPVRYMRLAGHPGVVAARNEGIAASLGEWIAECDSDDVWAADKLERQLEFLRAWKGRPIAMLGTYGYNMNDAKKVISKAAMGPVSEADYDELRRTAGLLFVIHSSVLFPRSAWEAAGRYSTDYGAADEFDFFGRMAEQGVVVNVPEPLVYYRKRSGSMQMDLFWDKQRGAWRVAENQRRRQLGPQPSGAREFAAQLAAAPARERFRRRRHTTGMYYYRRGAAHFVNGQRARGAAELLLSSVMDAGRMRAGALGALRARLTRG